MHWAWGNNHSRAIILLFVIVGHGMLVMYWVHSTSVLRRFLPRSDPMIVHFLRQALDKSTASERQGTSKIPRRRFSRASHATDASTAISVPTPLSAPVDWQHEAELTIGDIRKRADKENGYRNLAGLSPAQLEWIKRNHLEPMPPEFKWSHSRRVEVVDGIPIYILNDHCVLVALIIPVCAIGHIEPNGDLFKHMHDPKPP